MVPTWTPLRQTSSSSTTCAGSQRTHAASPPSAPARSCWPRPGSSKAGARPRTGPSASCSTRYADVTVDPDAIYVHDGNVWTSAGVTAGIDLALALVADDHGHGAAATVARQLVVYLQRSGGQAQFSALLAGQAADTEPVRDLLAWLRDHLADDLSVAALARQINLSERQFSRVFKAEVGATAADHVEAVRLDSACRLLESTNRTIEQIARTCGFGTPETMNRTFRRRLNTTPGEHRHHFRGERSHTR